MAQTLDSASPATTLTIVKTHDVWNLETDDSAFLAIIFTNGHDYYYCNYANLRLPDDVALLAAQAILIPRTYYQAQSPHGLHRVPKSLSEDTYLKVPLPLNIINSESVSPQPMWRIALSRKRRSIASSPNSSSKYRWISWDLCTGRTHDWKRYSKTLWMFRRWWPVGYGLCRQWARKWLAVSAQSI